MCALQKILISMIFVVKYRLMHSQLPHIIITLSGFNFFATTVYISGRDQAEDVSNIILDSCHFSYPSYSQSALG